MNKNIYIKGQEVAKKEYVDEQIQNIDLSSKQDVMQFSTMPEASSETVGKVIQYTGTTNQDYTNGYFYIGTVSGEVGEEVYSWERLAVQPETEIPADLKVFYIKQNDAEHPFIFDEHETGLYFFNYTNVLYDGTPYLQLYAKRSASYAGVIALWIYNCNYAIFDRENMVLKSYHWKLQQSTNVLNNPLNMEKSYSTLNTLGDSFNSGLKKSEDIRAFQIVDLVSPQTITGKKTFTNLPESSATPTTANQLVNKSYVDSLASAALKRQKVQTLPTEDIRTDTIYMVPSSDPEQGNVLDEYMYIDDAWEKIGSSSVDLTDYYTKDEVNALLDNRLGDIDTILDDILAGSVDAEEREY